MKNTFFLRNLLCTALFSVMLIGCGGGRDYRTLLPGDAFMVTSMNLKSLREKANVGDPAQSVFHKQIQKMLESNTELSDADRSYILSLVSNPSETGIDEASDCFMFMKMTGTVQAEGGMLFRIKDLKKFETFIDFAIQKGAPEKRAEKGFTLVADDTTPMMVAYNTDGVMIFFSDGGYQENIPRVTELFNQKEENSLLANKGVMKAFEAQNDVCMVISYANMPTMMGMESIPMINSIMKSTLVCPMNFERGKIVAESKIYFPDSETEKQFMDNVQFMTKQNGSLLKFIPENSIATFGMCMNGAKMYETLAAMPVYAQAMAAMPQAKSVMDAVEGDMIISFSSMDATGKIPQATVIAELNDIADIQTVMGMLKAMPVKETAPYQYDFEMMGIKVSFGLQDKMFYATTDPTAASAIKGNAIPTIENRFGKLFNGSYGTFAVDFVAIHTMLQTMVANGTVPSGVARVLPFIQIFDTWEMSSANIAEGSMVINMTDRERNALDTIYYTFETMMASMMDEEYTAEHSGDACCGNH